MSSQFDAFAKAGFEVLLFANSDYISRCHGDKFEQDGKEQSLKLCAIRHWALDIDSHYIFYDTLDQFPVAPQQRSQQWKFAMSHIINAKYFLVVTPPTKQISQHFYDVTVDPSDLEAH